MHEASLHEDNCFLTLTYCPEELPTDMSLRKRDWQLFAKRMRKRVGPFRFFHCGEYGPRSFHPHYHAVIFGYDFPDKEYLKGSDDMKLYSSDLLEDLWGLGLCSIGNVSFESASYVARYCVDKLNNANYSRVNFVDGEVYNVQPEYGTMSRRPGIGREWFQKFGSEVFPSDEVISRGFPAKPPRYYDSLLADAEPSVFDAIKLRRVERAAEHAANCTPARLRVREKIAKAKLSLFKRRPL